MVCSKERAPPLLRHRSELGYGEPGEGDGRDDDEEEEYDETRDEYEGEREHHERRGDEEYGAHETDEPRVGALKYFRVRTRLSINGLQSLIAP